jgi:tRNA 5-methylaminomethyl-2-thiouridine biosynthesis bifunctional protein
LSRQFIPIKTQTINWRHGQAYLADTNKLLCSGEDAFAQSERVFIQGNDLLARWQSLVAGQSQSFVIAETHFGFGLNFLIGWYYWLQYAPADACLHYLSCTHQPINKMDLEKLLVFWPQLQPMSSSLLADYPILTPGFHPLSWEDGRVKLTLLLGEPDVCFQERLYCGEAALESILRSRFVDAWFVNGPENFLVNDSLFQSIAMLSRPGTSLTSTMIETTQQASLQKAGFDVTYFDEAKRFLKATSSQPGQSLRKKQTPWFLPCSKPPKSKRALILGAGLAGCFTANALAKRGWDVVLVEAASDIALGASGNGQSVLYPKLSAFASPLAEFMLSAYLYANRVYKKLLQSKEMGELKGMLQLAHNSKQTKSQAHLKSWLEAYPELGSLVDESEATQLAGIPLVGGGLYLPLSGWIDPKALGTHLLDLPNIRIRLGCRVDQLQYKDQRWVIDNEQAEILILANGFSTNQFQQTELLPLIPNLGQLTQLASNEQTACLKIPLCGDAHVLPQRAGLHLVGATYHPGISERLCREVDDKENLAQLSKIPTSLAWSNQIMGHWAGTRAATPDYLPMVGPVPIASACLKLFASLSTDSKRWIPTAGEYYPGLYVCTGFGSRGLTSIPLCSEWLASFINQEFGFLPSRMIQSISPARFLIKK